MRGPERLAEVWGRRPCRRSGDSARGPCLAGLVGAAEPSRSGLAGAARGPGVGHGTPLSPGYSSPGSGPAAASRLRSARRRLRYPRQPPAKWRRGGAGRGRGAAESPAPAPAWTHLPLCAGPPPSGLPRGRGCIPLPSALGEPMGPRRDPPRRPRRPVSVLLFPAPPPAAWKSPPSACLPVTPAPGDPPGMQRARRESPLLGTHFLPSLTPSPVIAPWRSSSHLRRLGLSALNILRHFHRFSS